MSIKSEQYELDLDTFVVNSKSVKLNGKIFNIEIPDMQTLFELSSVGAKLQSVSGTDKNATKKTERILNKLKNVIFRLCPNLKNEKMTFAQMMGLLSFITKMAIPKDMEQMEKRGIKLDDNQKKTE